ncbi:MAG: reverse transcriptase family protein, partial [Candidatus Thiodiazotropha endolucinida]|nr:reverse transcriptase family protein [Candidatus Thiodiazotropha endolucinida]
MLAYKSYLDKHITYIESDSKLVLWFKLSDGITKCGNVLCGVVYIPPENSDYAVEAPFSEIEEELQRFSGNCSSVLLLGDTNSRPRNLPDYILPDRDIFMHNDLGEIYDDVQTEMSAFSRNNLHVTLHRQNPDGGINNYGYRLIDFCRDNNIYILNGRVKGNSGVRNTCKNISTVDYFLSTSSLFQCVENLNVFDFCEIFSDVHSPVGLTLNMAYCNHSERKNNTTVTIKLWDTEKAENFAQELDESMIGNILNSINDLESKGDICQKDVDDIAEALSDTFKSAAMNSFGTVRKNVGTNSNKPPHWFNRKCKVARKKFHRAKYLYKLRPTCTNKHNLSSSSKCYKKTMSVEQKLFKRSKIKELRKIKSSEPRKFWKFLNGIKNSSAEVTLESCFEYFRTMNASQNQENIPEANFPENEYNLETNAEINGSILWSEIEKAVCSLKNNKAGGLDMIVNEHIKNCYKLPNMRIILLKLFNIVFESGYVPTSWSTGNIIPIYKQKGDQTDPSNYRPITLLSCLGKLFTRILNDRLQQYSDKYDKISQNQAGFRKRFSTTDHIFALHMLINLVQNRRNKLFCAFIDLKRAFDTVWRDGLFHKMKLFNINGKCYNVVKNMYNNIKSCVTVNGNSSPLFACNIGVRQGENLSPLLFSIFLNDLEDHLSRSGNIDGISIASNNINENAYFFLKIFVLLYADDTVILAESDEDLQHALNAYATYCENWKLSVNTDKTKIMIFSKGRQ